MLGTRAAAIISTQAIPLRGLSQVSGKNGLSHWYLTADNGEKGKRESLREETWMNAEQQQHQD